MKRCGLLLFFCCILLLANDIRAAGGDQLWRFITGGRIRAYPAIARDGTAYILSDDRFLYAITAEGEQKWRFFLEDRLGDCFTVGQDNTLYIGYKTGTLVALHVLGKQIWSFPTRQTIMYSPVQRADGTLFIITQEGTLYAISHTGRLRWTYALNGAPSSAPVIDSDGSIYVPLAGGALLCLQPWGEKKWSIPLSGAPSSPAIGLDGTVYVGTDQGSLYAIAPLPKIRWTQACAGALLSPVIARDNSIYVPAANGIVYAFSPDGVLQWTVRLEGGISGSCAVGDGGTIFAGTQKSLLYAINPLGQILWELPVKGEITNIVLSPRKTLFVGSSDWTLYAFDAEKPAVSAWPLFQHDFRHSGRSTRPVSIKSVDEIYFDNPDYIYLRAMLLSYEEELMKKALADIEGRVAGNEIKKSRPYIMFLLEKIAGFGVTNQDRVTNYPLRGFSPVRERACLLYLEIGRLETHSLFRNILENEADVRMKTVALYCLGVLKSDPDGLVSDTVCSLIRGDRGAELGSTFAYQAAITLGSILEYQGFLSSNGITTLLDIGSGKYGKEPEEQARKVISVFTGKGP